MSNAQPLNRQAVHEELELARADFHHLLRIATKSDLARPSDGTRWTNEQLLFHMLFGYMVVLTLLRLVRLFGRLPDGASRAWARLLNSGTRPFDVVNYLGSCAAATFYNHRRMGAKCDRVIAALHRRLDQEDTVSLARGMYYPVRWDPFFRDYMTLADLYRYPTRHFDFHRRQLTMGDHR
ncbi:DinB family protein [Actinomadura kijaniata]|uniref:DinB family protein n=1 Tax=Actinomadura kijaniata TaxID=46161 RepID=UPI003F1ACB6D